jgi:hypothetical protein
MRGDLVKEYNVFKRLLVLGRRNRKEERGGEIKGKAFDIFFWKRIKQRIQIQI